MNASKPTVHVNGIDYRWPLRPVVVVCIDGGDPAYLQQFLSEGIIPNIARFIQQGFSTVAGVPCSRSATCVAIPAYTLAALESGLSMKMGRPLSPPATTSGSSGMAPK